MKVTLSLKMVKISLKSEKFIIPSPHCNFPIVHWNLGRKGRIYVNRGALTHLSNSICQPIIRLSAKHPSALSNYPPCPGEDGMGFGRLCNPSPSGRICTRRSCSSPLPDTPSRKVQFLPPPSQLTRPHNPRARA